MNIDQARWDLSVLYTGIDDPQIAADLNSLLQMMERFASSYRGKLTDKLGTAITEYSEIVMLESKIQGYLFLLQTCNVSDATIKARYAEVNTRIDKASAQYLTFFRIEIMHLEDGVLSGLYTSDPVVGRHRPWIDQIRIFKSHALSEPVEAALTTRSSVGPYSWSEFFDEVESDISIDFESQKKSLKEVLHITAASQDADQRAQALEAVHHALGGYVAKYAAQNLYMVVAGQAVEDKERGYRHPMERRNLVNKISDDVVDALHIAVHKTGGPLMRRYYRLKAAHLGLKTLRWSDRNAPMPFADSATIPFEKAVDMVTAAYQSFSPTMAGLVRETLEKKRVDGPPLKEKRSGGYNYSFMIPGGTPVSFIFLNYLASSQDVRTLAHEMGHAVHGLLAAQAQGPLMHDTPMAYAETASKFGERITFEFLDHDLVQRGNDPKSRLVLLMSKIDDDINTVMRQISFSNFERRIHGMDASYSQWHEPKKLSVPEYDAIWLAVTKELYGDEGEIFTYEHADHLWSYVSHFHNPFYVYSYAFGQLLTDSLYAQREKLGDRFEPLYLDLLRAGGTKDVVELLQPFGLDPRDETFWTAGIEQGMGRLIAEAEALSHSMGVSI